jgi:hypothetical protein
LNFEETIPMKEVPINTSGILTSKHLIFLEKMKNNATISESNADDLTALKFITDINVTVAPRIPDDNNYNIHHSSLIKVIITTPTKAILPSFPPIPTNKFFDNIKQAR